MEIVFNRPLVLVSFFLLPVLIVLHFYFFQHNKKRAIKFANFSAMKRVTGTKLITKNTVQLIILSLLILIIAQPIIWYDSNVSITDYVIAIDSSASMVSTDVLPNRLAVAKQAATSFLEKLDVETKIGIVSFSGVSYIKSPLTSSMGNVRRAISNIDIELSGGTDIGSALITSVNLFDNIDEAKSIILITDGSDTAGTFIEEGVDIALDYVKLNHVIVHTIAVGTGSAKAGYLDELNLPAAYDKVTLEKIAQDTGGSYYDVESSAEISLALKEIENKSEQGKVSYDTLPLLFIIAVILLLLEWGLLNTKFRALP